MRGGHVEMEEVEVKVVVEVKVEREMEMVVGCWAGKAAVAAVAGTRPHQQLR